MPARYSCPVVGFGFSKTGGTAAKQSDKQTKRAVEAGVLFVVSVLPHD